MLLFLAPWRPTSDSVPFGIEAIGQQTTWQSHAFQMIRSGKWDPFSPGILAGYPFLAETEAFPLYPLKAAFMVFPAHQALSITLLVHFLLLFHGTFLLARTWSGSNSGALTAGCIAVFCGPVLGTVLAGHLSQFASFAWLPWITWAWYKALGTHRLRFGALGAFFMLMSLAAGHVQFSVMAATGSLVLAGLGSRQYRQRKGTRVSTALFLVGTGLSALVCAALWLLPLRELVHFSNRSEGFSPSVLLLQSLHFHQLITALVPDIFGNTATTPYIGLLIHEETTCFIGILPFLLTLAGCSFRDPRDRAALFLLVFGTAMSLTVVSLPLARMLDSAVPFQLPLRWRLLAAFSMALLAGQGVSRLLAGTVRLRRILFAGALVLLLLAVSSLWLFPMKGWESLLTETSSEFAFGIRKGLLIGEHQLNPVSILQSRAHAVRSLWTAFLFACLSILILLGIDRFRNHRIWARLSVCVAVIVFLGIFVRPLVRNTPWSRCGWPAEFVSYLKNVEGPFRVQSEIPFERSNPPFPPPYQKAFKNLYRYDKTTQDWGLVTGIESTTSGFSMLTKSYQRLTGIFWTDIELPDKISRRRLNVRYVMAPVSKPPDGVDPIPLAIVDDIGLFEDKSALPRASFFTNWRTGDSGDQVTLPAISDLGDDPVPRPSLCGNPGTGRDPIPLGYRREPGPTFTVTANVGCPGIVLLSELYYPGFAAWIDGTKTRLLLAWGGLMAVYVPAGDHRIRFQYKPDVWRQGACISAAGLVALGWFTFYAWRSDRKRFG